MQNTYSWLGLGVAIAILLVGGIFLINKKGGGAGSVSTSTPSTTASTTTVDLGNGTSVTGPAGSIVAVPDNGVQPPALSSAIIIASNTSLSPEAQTVVRNDETALIAQIKKTPTRVDLWLKLGVYRKMAGDYAGAIVAWNYVAAAAPNSASYVAYADLGDLYMNFQVDYPKAEANYKTAIAIKPTVIDYYKDLYTLYTSFYKTNQGLANAIVAQGLKANPGNADLLQLRSQIKSSTQ